MIEEYVPTDRRHENFCGRFMEQRIQKLNNPKQPGVEDCLPFSIELLRAVPAALPRRQFSNISRDSRVNSLQALSPEMPVTPDNAHSPQPYLMPSTSRMYPPSLKST